MGVNGYLQKATKASAGRFNISAKTTTLRYRTVVVKTFIFSPLNKYNALDVLIFLINFLFKYQLGCH